MKKRIFIDGQAGTTGLQIHSRLQPRNDIEIIEIDYDKRRDAATRKEAINSADVVILCLPDDAAREAVSLVESDSVRVLDASSAHRITKEWTYGLPEISAKQRDDIHNAKLVSNPGCYPTGGILMLRPLVEANLLDANFPFAVNAISGYSGGGKQTIDRFENKHNPDYIDSPVRRYALHHEHKHIKEMKAYANLNRKPVFMPTYGRFRQGIILQVPIHLSAHKASLSASDLRDKLASHYEDSKFCSVASQDDTLKLDGIDPQIHNNTNHISLYVLEPKDTDHAVLCAVYDNLGKGASGAAVQNLEIMLDLIQSEGNV